MAGREPLATDAESATHVELVLVVVAAAVALTGVVGLLLAVADQYRTPFAVGAGGVMALLAAVWLVRTQRFRAPSRSEAIGWLVAFAIAAAFVGFVGSAQSQHVLTDRDPAVYQVAARWLAAQPGLDIDPAAGAFEEVGQGDLVFGGGPIYTMSDGNLQFQFNHLSVVLLAAAFDVGGTTALSLAPALMAALGLLGVYGVAVRGTRRPLLSTLAPAALALSMPLLFVTRDTYSEPFVMGLLWIAALAALWNYRRPSLVLGGLTGVFIGALVGIRVDSLAVVAVMVLLAALSVTTVRDSLRSRLVQSYCVATVSMAIAIAVGLADLRLRSGRYETDLKRALFQLDMAAVAAIVLAALLLVLWFTLPAVRRWVAPLPERWAGAVGLLVSALFFGAWLIRPLVSVAHGRANSTVEAIQQREDMLVEPARTYAEHSLWWMSWYLGPVTVALALVGIGLCVRAMLRGRSNAALSLVVSLCIALGGLYWWRPSNTPDQVWVMRRYVPVVLPCLVLLAVVCAAMLAEAAPWRRAGRAARVVAAGALVVFMLVPPALTTWPVRSMTFQPGYGDALDELCETIGPDAAVLITESYERLVLSQAIRSWCQVPVASIKRPFSAVDYANVAELVGRRGRELWLVSLDDATLAATDVEAEAVVSTSSKDADRTPVAQLDAPPDRYISPNKALHAVPTPFAIHARRVERP